jgi:hypothetical protein
MLFHTAPPSCIAPQQQMTQYSDAAIINNVNTSKISCLFIFFLCIRYPMRPTRTLFAECRCKGTDKKRAAEARFRRRRVFGSFP